MTLSVCHCLSFVSAVPIVAIHISRISRFPWIPFVKDRPQHARSVFCESLSCCHCFISCCLSRPNHKDDAIRQSSEHSRVLHLQHRGCVDNDDLEHPPHVLQKLQCSL